MFSLWRDYLEVAEDKNKKEAVKPPVAKARTAKKAPAAKKTAATGKVPKAEKARKPNKAVKPEAEPVVAKPEKVDKPQAKPSEAATANKAAETKAKTPKKVTKAPKIAGDYVPRLKFYYKDKVIPYMIDKFNYANPNMVPKLSKISINSRVSTSRDEVKDLESIVEDITIVAGQKAVVTRAKKAIANFKIRQGDPVGATVTIRGRRMYEFLDRLVSIAIPRVRDFNGLREKSFDGFGNFSFGVKEQIIFPEIDYDKVDKIRGMDVTIVTTANTDEEGYELLKSLGMPFRIIELAEPDN